MIASQLPLQSSSPGLQTHLERGEGPGRCSPLCPAPQTIPPRAASGGWEGKGASAALPASQGCAQAPSPAATQSSWSSNLQRCLGHTQRGLERCHLHQDVTHTWGPRTVLRSTGNPHMLAGRGPRGRHGWLQGAGKFPAGAQPGPTPSLSSGSQTGLYDDRDPRAEKCPNPASHSSCPPQPPPAPVPAVPAASGAACASDLTGQLARLGRKNQKKLRLGMREVISSWERGLKPSLHWDPTVKNEHLRRRRALCSSASSVLGSLGDGAASSGGAGRYKGLNCPFTANLGSLLG